MGKLEIRSLVRSILSEGKNPVSVAQYYLKDQPEMMRKLTLGDNSLLKKLASLDVEYNPEKFEVGKIFPWLMALWKKGDNGLNSLLKSGPNSPEAVKFKNAQQLFSRPAFRKTTAVTDIQSFGSLKDFMDKVDGAFIEKEELPSMPRFSVEEINNDIREGNIAKTNISNDRFLVVTPLKKKGACKYGNVHMAIGAGRWCTANEQNNAFDSYKDGTLYIFMDRTDGYLSKYQFHYKDGTYQFKDERNKDFDYEAFFDENTDIFDRLFPEIASVVKLPDLETKTIPDIYKVFGLLPKIYKEAFRKKMKISASGILGIMLGVLNGQINPKGILDNKEILGYEVEEDDVKFYDGGMRINIDLDDIQGGLINWYWAGKNGYDYYEFQSDEWDYISSYVPENKKQEFLDLIRLFDSDFKGENFDDEGAIYGVIGRQPAYKYFEKLLHNFARNYEMAINDAQSAYIDTTLERLPFSLENDSVYIDFNKFTSYLIEKGINQIDEISAAIENILDDEGVSDDNFYDHYSAGADFERLEKEFSSDIDSVKESIEDDEDLEAILNNSKKFLKMMKDLGFKNVFNHWNAFKKVTDFAEIILDNPNYENYTVNMTYKELKDKKKIHKGEIPIDNVPKYATMPMMFESEYRLRSEIRKSISRFL